MGGIVGTAMIQRHPGLVTRMMTIGTPPDVDSSTNPGPTQRLVVAPVIGPTVKRLASDDQVRAELERTFIRRVDVPQALVDDIPRTTFTSFRESGREAHDYREAEPLPQRLARAGVPLTAVDGSRDRVVDPDSLQEWRAVPGARVVLLRGLGHTPQVEAPRRTAALILTFAAG
jgi:pimeloyl-ACP methyl ester carboxylesterase